MNNEHMKSVLVFVLIVYGTFGQEIDIWGDGEVTQAPVRQTVERGCIGKGQSLGVCVKNSLYCNMTYIIEGPINWRFARSTCPNDGMCCPLWDVIPATTNTTTTSSTTPPENAVECGVQKRQTVPDFVKTRVNEADPGEFPWAVSLMIKKYQFGSYPMFSYTGTGSLIHDRVVLTAAHVLENKNLENLYATVGEHDVFNKILPKKAIKVTEVVVHNKFVSSNGNYNFALAFLRSSATANLPHVGTVCLPPADFMASAGASCAFSGWGTDSAQKQIVQLTKTEVPMMTHSACEQKLKQLFGPRFKLHASFTCAGGEVGRDICTGGGGSPLVCPIEGQGRYVQTGIVSWVPDGCGVDGASIVFADVAAARPWIDQQMAEHLYSTASYTY